MKRFTNEALGFIPNNTRNNKSSYSLTALAYTTTTAATAAATTTGLGMHRHLSRSSATGSQGGRQDLGAAARTVRAQACSGSCPGWAAAPRRSPGAHEAPRPPPARDGQGLKKAVRACAPHGAPRECACAGPADGVPPAGKSGPQPKARRAGPPVVASTAARKKRAGEEEEEEKTKKKKTGKKRTLRSGGGFRVRQLCSATGVGTGTGQPFRLSSPNKKTKQIL